jgi:hypothetical protein
MNIVVHLVTKLSQPHHEPTYSLSFLYLGELLKHDDEIYSEELVVAFFSLWNWLMLPSMPENDITGRALDPQQGTTPAEPHRRP